MTEVITTQETMLVVGAGISGLTAALEAANTGHGALLVEKNSELGSFAV